MAADSGDANLPHRKAREGEWVYRSIRGKGKIYFIRHALDRMKQRRIGKNEVLDAIKSPNERDLPTREGRVRVRWYRSERTAIDVVYEEHVDFFRVITATTFDRSASAAQQDKKRPSKRKGANRQRKPK